MQQRSLKHAISAEGIGLHSGHMIHLTIKPAPTNTGIVFKRIDHDNPELEIPAHVDYVVDTRMNTTLGRDGVTIGTVEHLLSALAGLGIDNAIIELDGPEIPAMDGSAHAFVFLIQSAGIEKQSALKKFIRLKESITIEEEDKHVSLEPSEKGFSLDVSIDFNHAYVKEHCEQRAHLTFSSNQYIKHISRARTFGFIQEIEALQKQNLAQGASLENAIAIDETGILNEEGLRGPDELVKHKLLDAIGDLYLLGTQVLGHYKGIKSGHAMHAALARKLLQSPNSWEYVTYPEQGPLAFQDGEV